MGGVLAGVEEYRHGDRADASRVSTAIEHTAGQGTTAVLQEARESGKTPTRILLERVLPLIEP